MNSIDRYRGALLGLATGDALGTTLEFRSPGTFEPLEDMVGGGPFQLPVGAWTDDTAMALCLAESLVEKQGFDPRDQMERYLRWWQDGYMSSTGRSFDIGNATAASLRRFDSTGDPYSGDEFPDAAGNGALMRLAPISLAFARHPVDLNIGAARASRTTHGSLDSIDACRYFAELIGGALNGVQKEELIGGDPYSMDGYFGITSEAVAQVAQGSFRNKQPPEIVGNGYVIDTLEAALWALYTTDNFASGLLKVVNLGGDADTTGAVYGQLAGALYGVNEIPDEWLEKLVMKERIEAFADRLLELSFKLAAPAPPLPNDAYWVVDGRLVAGPYPGKPDEDDATDSLQSLTDAGVTHFVDLTFPKGVDSDHLEPYEHLLGKLNAGSVGHTRYSIKDLGVPTPELMNAILNEISDLLARGEVPYVHCWGGVGRTGTVVACHLISSGMTADDALSTIHARRSGLDRSHRDSPETSEQMEFVHKWDSKTQAGGAS